MDATLTAKGLGEMSYLFYIQIHELKEGWIFIRSIPIHVDEENFLFPS